MYTVCIGTDATAATMAVPAGASIEPFERRADAPNMVFERQYIEVSCNAFACTKKKEMVAAVKAK